VSRPTFDDRLKRLKDQFKDLKEFSRTAFWSAQFLPDLEISITGTELARLLQRKQHVDQLSSYLTRLYTECAIHGHTWSLVLAAPDDEANLEHIESQDDILMEFGIFQGDQVLRTYLPIGILTVSCSKLRATQISELMTEIHHNTRLQMLIGWSTPIKELLAEGSSAYRRTLRSRGMHC
jgi:hypothetical protein